MSNTVLAIIREIFGTMFDGGTYNRQLVNKQNTDSYMYFDLIP